jgi:HPt (histidine-containing phosphotransfer) domain-containing protein
VDTLSKIDPAVVAELRRISAPGSADLSTRLVSLFRSGSVDALRQLQASLEASAFQAARAICHRLKSSAANVGALEFSRHVAQLERSCVGGDLARATRLLEGLQAAHASLVAELEEMCQDDLSERAASSAVAARR